MIKIQSNTPLIWQNDTSYMLPNYTGAVQWNGQLKCFEVSMGGGWQKIENTISLTTDPRWESVINWAMKKMQEEEELARLVAKHPTLASLVAQKKETEKQIEMVKTLIKEEAKI